MMRKVTENIRSENLTAEKCFADKFATSVFTTLRAKIKQC